MKFVTNVTLLLLLFQKVDLEAIPHRLKGPSHHSLGAIENLNSFKASFSFRAPFMFIVSLCWENIFNEYLIEIVISLLLCHTRKQISQVLLHSKNG